MMKILQKFIYIISADNTFFTIMKKPSDIKLPKSAVIANYIDLSPFKNSDLVFKQDKEYIYIWFFPKKPIDKVFIPEGYLLYKSLKKEDEVIGIYRKSKNIVVITVVKHGKLISQFVTDEINLDKKLDLVIKEHSLKNPKKKEISKILEPSFIDIFVFAYPEISIENLYQIALKYILIPTSLFFLISTVYYFILNNYIETQLEEKSLILSKLKEQTKDIKDLLFEIQEKREFWENFIKTEKKFPSLYVILNEILKTIRKNNGYINHIEISGNYINLWVGIKSKNLALINDLINTGLFKEVKVISSVKDKEKKDYEILNIEIFLKDRNE